MKPCNIPHDHISEVNDIHPREFCTGLSLHLVYMLVGRSNNTPLVPESFPSIQLRTAQRWYQWALCDVECHHWKVLLQHREINLEVPDNWQHSETANILVARISWYLTETIPDHQQQSIVSGVPRISQLRMARRAGTKMTYGNSSHAQGSPSLWAWI